MRIKSFKLFESEQDRYYQTFTSNQFADFCNATYVWSRENAQPVNCCLTSERFWNYYVKDDATVTLTEHEGALVVILHRGDMVEKAFDNYDKPFDLNIAKELLA